VELPDCCTDRVYVRVRARSAAGPSGWSHTRLWNVVEDTFDRCGRAFLQAPVLRRPRLVRGELRLRWTGPGTRFRLERAADPSFTDAEVVYEGELQQKTIWVPTKVTYFRVAAATAGEESPWSITRTWRPPLGSRWEVIAPGAAAAAAAGVDPAARLLDIHTSLLRLCAARSDMVVALSLPVESREEQALAHVRELDSRLGATAEAGDAGARALSFGALYHPWTVLAPAAGDRSRRARMVPPDGAICGLLAARALEAGAWTVPANRPLGGVVALEPTLGDGARAAFFGRRVNAVAPFPEGFMVLSEETLSRAPELTGIGVRRLLILLRRIALREGDRYLFRPNDASFRRLVQRQFDGILGLLFGRGAFAGARPAEGFRVVTDGSVNPPESVEQGRFVVELRVAPSRPLHFLTVRLVQTGAGLAVMEA
jgi:hypothetical protein